MNANERHHVLMVPCPRCGNTTPVLCIVRGDYARAAGYEPEHGPEIEPVSPAMCLEGCTLDVYDREALGARAEEKMLAQVHQEFLDAESEHFTAIRRMGRGPA